VVPISRWRASQIFNTSVDRSEGRIYDRIDSPRQTDSPRQSGKHLVPGAPQRAPVSVLIS
jgi:hypothetical protein